MNNPKIFVAEAADPTIGIWRDITLPLASQAECTQWHDHIKRQGISDVRIQTGVTDQGKPIYWVQARRRA